MSSIKTENLIQSLAQGAARVRRLPHPALRAATWMVLAAGSVGVLVFWFGVRADLAAKLGETRFALEVAAALLTSVMAAAAAFCSSCPGRPFWERLAPFPFLAVWLGSLGEGCWREYSQVGSATTIFGIDLDCSEKILLMSLVPAAIIFVMIAKGAPIAPRVTTGLGALAATALAASGLRLLHPEDGSMMLIVWQFGTVVVLTSLATLAAPLMLRWRHVNRSVKRDV